MHLRAADYRVMPWKNGAGSTAEMAVEPPTASVATGFAWRLSLAAVGASGPFSAFPGYDRVIVQLRGAPMRLVHAENGAHTLAPFVPYRFPGEWETAAVLAGGEAQDFNVMTRRGAAAAHVESLKLTPPELLTRAGGTLLAIFVARGSVTVRSPAGGAEVEEGELVLVRGLGEGLVTLSGAPAQVLVVTFGLLPALAP